MLFPSKIYHGVGMRFEGEEENVAAFSFPLKRERKCRNTTLEEDGTGDPVSDCPQGTGLREFKAVYSGFGGRWGAWSIHSKRLAINQLCWKRVRKSSLKVVFAI